MVDELLTIEVDDLANSYENLITTLNDEQDVKLAKDGMVFGLIVPVFDFDPESLSWAIEFARCMIGCDVLF